jgi:hypothetical protein
MFLYQAHKRPENRRITYGKKVCNYKPHKKKKEHIRLAVGGERLDYSGDATISTADITTFKILVNSTLSTEDAAMMLMDIKNYYISTPLPQFEYMKILLSRFPEEIIQKYSLNAEIVQRYNLSALAVDGWAYIEIQKRHVRIETSGITRQPITANAFGTIWILPCTPHPWTMSA